MNCWQTTGPLVTINGLEVARDNLPQGPISHWTKAPTARNGSAESAVREFDVDGSMLQIGTNVIGVEVHQNYRTSSDISFNASLEERSDDPGGGGSPISIFEMDSDWEYLDTGTNNDPTWATPDFSQSWAAGNAELGYGDGDETTVVSYGDNPDRKHYSTWFRKDFILDEIPEGTLVLELVVDDGAVVYLNGTEAARDNMPDGEIRTWTKAASARNGSAESTVREFHLDSSLLQTGPNTIGVEVHQKHRTSSDLSFNLRFKDSNLSFKDSNMVSRRPTGNRPLLQPCHRLNMVGMRK